MKLVFLGTGTSQGIPVIGCSCQVCQSSDFRDKRLRVSVLFQIGSTNIIIDTGPDFRQQMLRERISKIDAILYTHQHKDHTAGLDDIRPFNHKHNMDMPLYGRRSVLDQLKTEFSYIFENITYPGIPRVVLNEIQNQDFFINGIKITPIEVMHHRLPVYGFRIGDIAYITDANFISEKEKAKIRGSKILVINALQKTPHLSHFTLNEAINLIQELKPDQAYLIHMSHTMGTHKETSSELPSGIQFAYDGLVLEL
ncbi:MAG: MBL fold metallo-hydrolase [Opitutaceae bacterium]|nr:MBL fold metallo-hydrolase [Cytophagales bacterium]